MILTTPGDCGMADDEDPLGAAVAAPHRIAHRNITVDRRREAKKGTVALPGIGGATVVSIALLLDLAPAACGRARRVAE